MTEPWPPAQLDTVTVALRDVLAANRELIGRMARAMALNATDMSAIGALILNGPMGATDLSRHLGIRTASATVAVDRLERAGHVERLRDTVDRRRVTVTPTPAARRANHDAWAPVIGGIDDICRAVPAEHREALVEVLTQVADLLRTSAPMS